MVEALVVIALIATLAAMIFPVLARAKLPANGAVCAANLRQIGLAVDLYAGDNDARYPLGVNSSEAFSKCRPPVAGPPFVTVIGRYVPDPRLFRCPLDFGVPDVGAANYGESIECDLPGTSNMYERYDTSYEYRNDLGADGAAHPATLIGMYDGKEHGPSEVPVLWDAYGLWHGTKDETMELGGRRIYNASFADGHLKPVTPQQLAASGTWSVSGAR